jgi:hypothetical protein
MRQSAKLWYEYLKSLGFKHNEIDPSIIMNKMVDGR